VIGKVPIVLIVAEDGRSVRAFRRDRGEQTLELFRKTDTTPLTLCRLAEPAAHGTSPAKRHSGPMQGQSLERVQTLKDFWFDWKQYHAKSEVFSAGV
jgi:hypothetical protein